MLMTPVPPDPSSDDGVLPVGCAWLASVRILWPATCEVQPVSVSAAAITAASSDLAEERRPSARAEVSMVRTLGLRQREHMSTDYLFFRG